PMPAKGARRSRPTNPRTSISAATGTAATWSGRWPATWIHGYRHRLGNAEHRTAGHARRRSRTLTRRFAPPSPAGGRGAGPAWCLVSWGPRPSLAPGTWRLASGTRNDLFQRTVALLRK